MEPIISPWFFYLLGVVESMNVILAIFLVAAITGLVISIIGYTVTKYCTDDDWEEYVPVWKKWLRLSLICTIAFSIPCTFIPSKNTLIWMVVAKNVTYQNAEKAIEAGDNIRDVLKKDMIDIIQALQKEKDTDK